MKCLIRIQNLIVTAKSVGSFLLLQVLFSAAVSAQVEVQVKVDKLTCDSIHFNADTTDIIFYKKQKNGVYDLQAHKMLIKPTKNPILMLFSADLYLQITKDGFQMDHFTDGINRFTYETDDLTGLEAVFPAPVSDQYKNVVELNGTMVNYENGEMIQTDSVFMSEFISETVFKLAILDENRVLINYARWPIDPLMSGNDKDVFDPGFGKSGVLNKITKKWEIPAIYKSIEMRDSFLFCLNESATRTYTSNDFVDSIVSYDRSYDVFVQRNGEWILKFSQLVSWSEESLKLIMGWDEAQFASDSLHIISEINGKKGLWQLELFHETEMNAPVSSLIYNQLLANSFDLIFIESEDHLVVSYAGNTDLGLTLYNEVSMQNGELKLDTTIQAQESLVYVRGPMHLPTIFSDQQILDYTNLITASLPVETANRTVRNNANLPEFSRAFGLSVLNDSLMLVHNYKLDSIDPFTPPLKSLIYPDEDSMHYDGLWWYAIYPPLIPGYSKSGVYNLFDNSWFFNPVFESIQVNDEQFLLKDNREDEGVSERLEPLYSLYNLDRKFLFQALTYTEITANFDVKTPPFFNLKFIPFHKQFSDKTIYPSIDPQTMRANYYAQHTDGTWEVYDFFPSSMAIQTQPLTQAKELIHYCPIYDYFVYVEADSIFIEIKDQTHAMHSKDGFFEVEIQVFGDGFEYALRTIGSDTLTRATSSLFDSTYFSGRKASYQMTDHRFIINENYRFDNRELYYGDWEIYWMDPEWKHGYKRYDSETAMIWQERNGVWEIKTPYYGKIEPTKLGYLVSTVSVQEFDKCTGASNTIPGRTILLDTNFKALSFLDYFDFESGVVYEFGVSLCNVGGCFLVGNNGEILTTAEWDYFELEDGRIKAVLYNYFLDEEYFYEEPGYGIEKVEYFDLPRE